MSTVLDRRSGAIRTRNKPDTLNPPFQPTDEKSQPGGYAALDGTTSLVPTAQLGTGVADATTALFGDQTFKAAATAAALAAETAARIAADNAEAASRAAADALLLVKTANLSDVANVGTSRTNLGLGDSATKNVGAIAGTVCAGDDGRLSDTRTPTDNTVSTVKLQNDAVTYAKIQNVSATDKLLGRSTAGAGDIEEIALTAAGRALIDDAAASDQRTTLGLGSAALEAYTAPTAFVPTLSFGGAAVGLTYTSHTGLYVKIGKLVIVHLRIQLATKGSSVGAAVIAGLPFNVASAAPAFATCSVPFYTSMAALVDGIGGYAAGGTSTINLIDGGAAGVAALTDANFTNNSDLFFTMAYISD